MPRAGYFGNAPPKGCNWCKKSVAVIFFYCDTQQVPSGYHRIFFIFYLADILLVLVRYHVSSFIKTQYLAGRL